MDTSIPAKPTTNNNLEIQLNSQTLDTSSLANHITFDQLLNWIRGGSIFRKLFSFNNVTLHTYQLSSTIRPFLLGVIIRVLARGECKIVDDFGQVWRITLINLLQHLCMILKEFPETLTLKRQVQRSLDQLDARTAPPSYQIDFTNPPIYLRTDLWFGTKSGGSIAHISGVINNLHCGSSFPRLFTSDTIPMCRSEIQQIVIPPMRKFWDYGEIPSFFYNQTFITGVEKEIQNQKFAFIYQRYSLNNYSGLDFALRYNKPFVLEYNGSEVWISRNWGRRLKNEKNSLRIETLNLRLANLIVVVSKTLKQELVERNITENKILVNPNGVDINLYNPGIQASSLADKSRTKGKIVIGFIGTFGPWHGAELLASAFVSILNSKPDLTNKIHLLMIGDGVRMPMVKDIIKKHKHCGSVTFTGLTRQDEGPDFLSLCDILVAPHVPNPDGSPFFGSPTKLFEYMAMGKSIVASDLNQIGEILCHRDTALLVTPNDTSALAEGILELIYDPRLTCSLGINARKKVCEKYSWANHTQRILDALKRQSI